MIIKSGEIFNTTYGAYSDYYLCGSFKALKDLDTGELVREFAKEHNLERKKNEASSYKKDIEAYEDTTYLLGNLSFLAWLSNGGYVEEAHVKEWYIGSYNEFNV